MDKAKAVQKSATDSTSTVDSGIETSNGKRLYLEILLAIELGQTRRPDGAGLTAAPDVLAGALEAIRDATRAKALGAGWNIPDPIRDLAGRTATAIRAAADQDGKRAQSVSLIFIPPAEAR